MPLPLSLINRKAPCRRSGPDVLRQSHSWSFQVPSTYLIFFFPRKKWFLNFSSTHQNHPGSLSKLRCCISNAFPGDAGIVAALGELFTDFLQNRSIPLWVYFHILEHLKFSRYVYGVSQMRYNLGEECVCS